MGVQPNYPYKPPLTPQDSAHNLYNVHSTRTTRYDSTDELKSDYSDNSSGYIETSGEQRPVTKHGSLDGAYKRRSRDFEGHPHYGSLERDGTITELTPSKFGSKRESTSDYRESIYPYPDNVTDLVTEAEQRMAAMKMQNQSHGGSLHRIQSEPSYIRYQVPQYVDSTYGSQSSVQNTSGSTNNQPDPPAGVKGWYDNSEESQRILRQQQAPSTPQYESPPPFYVNQESGNMHSTPYEHQQQQPQTAPPPPQHHTATHYQTVNSDQQPRVMVTKYQSFVEVSKPFEMSDFYKYSEKLRRQRTVKQQQQTLMGSSPPDQPGLEGQQQYSQLPPPHGGHYPQHQSPHHQHSPQAYPASPKPPIKTKPKSPYLPHRDHTGNGAYVQKTAASPSMYRAANVRGPFGAQHQQQHQHQQTPPDTPVYMSQAQYQASGQTPRHMRYQPVQPMTCEPVHENSSSNRSTPHRLV
jgi:hypothetical protein